jgi:hypothetical protein
VFEPRCSIFEDPVESKCASFTNLKDEHEALPGYSGSVSPCAGSSMPAKNDANDSIGMQAEFLPPTLTPGNSKLYDCISSVIPLPVCGVSLHWLCFKFQCNTCFCSYGVYVSQSCITEIMLG